MHPLPPELSWKKAAFLHERTVPEHAAPLEEGAALEHARHRARAWRQVMSADERLLDERLRSAGLDRERFLQILAHAESGTDAPRSQSWEGLLQEVIEDRGRGEPLPAGLAAPASALQPGLPFSGFLHPFLRLGAARLRAGFAALEARHPSPQPLMDPGLDAMLLGALASQLHELASRVLILELNVARLMDRLQGATPQERFHHFSTVLLGEPGTRAALLEEYPVLARLMATLLERWWAAGLEFLAHLAEDRALLEETFLEGRTLGPLVALQGGVSDLHRGGRGVFLLRFGSGLRLVYKPKSLAVDHRFQRLLHGLNGAGLRHPHRVLTVLDRGGHGWVEFVEAGGCDSREALQRFYWRQGSFLAVLHLLSAVDFHLENLIASGEFPVLVDLEALFHHRPPLEPRGKAHGRAWALLDRSIVAVGMLPLCLFGRQGRAGLDMSGLGGEAGQLTPQRIPTLEDSGSDTMRVVRRQGLMVGSHNRPLLGAAPVDPTEFTGELIQGFEETYALLIREREALVPSLRAFAGVEVRYIARATQRYAMLLQESHHPDFLRDGLERDKVLDHLWAEAVHEPLLRRLLPFEHADLRLGDIPFFTARPGERHLWSSTGECIPDFFTQDSLGEVLRRLERLDAEDCATQVSFIRKAMVALDKGRAFAPARAAPAGQEPLPEASPEECLEAAVALGERLAAKAIRGDRDVSWIGLNLDDLQHWRWSLSPLGTELYEGLGGLALFFAHLAARTGREDFEALARAALEPVREDWRTPGLRSGTGVGVFVGRGAAVYVLGHLAALWNEPLLRDELREGLPALEALIETDARLDLLSGSAGLAVALLGLYRTTGEARWLEAARQCGERLVATAVALPGDMAGWKGEVGMQPLAGFSHGVAGIAWALLELAEATKDPRYADLAHRGLAYERSLFVPERGQWKDLRAPDTEGHFMAMWCHGASGIALGRLLTLRHLKGPEVREELTRALETTLRTGFGGNHSLCHGDMGNLEVLHLAGAVLGEPRWTQAALQCATAVLRQGREGDWRCGLPRGSESPGLLMGLSGIGYGLLRLSAPGHVPSILSLASPSGE
ncbi:type 2 lanthipeptide synthetase LanM family protein [Stigmatella sp. ncwal1]|uniref:Type 2 lanthipeptide synthetase LanM family protein n=1 Tax=Stigmatella ashevillensis TaxID=2995309 RepID=A0ABT5DEJ5_9BACT|nr:type 2 lanthipeptide synthetase LanM family protein [Stigmatella ashevillena]MDC0712072.1 type 2 lanthipeptide synthetase LanM family protein [Stigmatella ashevillena]